MVCPGTQNHWGLQGCTRNMDPIGCQEQKSLHPESSASHYWHGTRGGHDSSTQTYGCLPCASHPQTILPPLDAHVLLIAQFCFSNLTRFAALAKNHAQTFVSWHFPPITQQESMIFMKKAAAGGDGEELVPSAVYQWSQLKGYSEPTSANPEGACLHVGRCGTKVVTNVWGWASFL